jgi:hypothetical protein
VTTQRLLPILTLLGCLVISGVIFAQWFKERGLDRRIESLAAELQTSRAETAAERLRAAALGRDVAQLKESIESAAAARRESETAAAQALADQQSQAAAMAAAAADQVKAWEKAIAERDAKIEQLAADLAAARARLDEAVKKLKAAGAG